MVLLILCLSESVITTIHVIDGPVYPLLVRDCDYHPISISSINWGRKMWHGTMAELQHNELIRKKPKKVRSGQVRGHTPVQCVAVSTSRRYFFGIRLAIPQGDVRPAMPATFR